MRYLDCIFSKVFFQPHFPTLPKDFCQSFQCDKRCWIIVLSTFSFSKQIILKTLMVIHSYLIRKNIYKYQKPSFETFALILNLISILWVLKKAAVEIHDLLTNTFLLRKRGKEGEWMLHFSIGPKVLIPQRDTSKANMQPWF